MKPKYLNGYSGQSSSSEGKEILLKLNKFHKLNNHILKYLFSFHIINGKPNVNFVKLV